MAERVIAYLGLGGNVGNVAAAMQAGLDGLKAQPQVDVTAVSRVYKTPPWGPVEQDWYLNACAEIETSLSPTQLLDMVLSIERSLGRIRGTRWGPRTLDIDILLFGDKPVSLEHLTIPHPRMTERAFVMVPLADIAPQRIIAGYPVSAYARGFGDTQIEAAEVELKV